MPTFKQFRLPDAGEGLTEAEILKWYVRPGDLVTVNQTIVEIETAKAIVELPCPFEGVVAELHATEGETVDVGVPIISVGVSAGASSPAAHNDVLTQLFDVFLPRLRLAMIDMLRIRPVASEAADHAAHERLVESIAARDAAAASAASRTHLSGLKEAFE